MINTDPTTERYECLHDYRIKLAAEKQQDLSIAETTAIQNSLISPKTVFEETYI